MGGCVNPSVRSWVLLVEYGHTCPRSTQGVNGLFAFKGVGGVGIRRSGGGSVGGSFGG